VWKDSSSEGMGSSKRELTSAPDPNLYMSQYTIFSIDNHVVLTVRKTHSSEDRMGSSCCNVSSGHQHDSHTPPSFFGVAGRSSNGGSSSSSSSSSHHTNKKHIECSLWDDLRERIRCADADVRVNSSSAKYIAFSALEVIMEHNYTLRDTLRKWLHDLEDAIQNSANTTHTIHLYEFSKLASVYLGELKAIAECLEQVCPNIGSGGTSIKPRPVELMRGDSRGMGSVEPGTARGEEEGSVLEGGVSAYFDNEYIFFKDLVDEVQTICIEVSKCSQLSVTVIFHHTNISRSSSIAL
jgi:hypothetical protein